MIGIEYLRSQKKKLGWLLWQVYSTHSPQPPAPSGTLSSKQSLGTASLTARENSQTRSHPLFPSHVPPTYTTTTGTAGKEWQHDPGKKKQEKRRRARTEGSNRITPPFTNSNL
jgi:hypothetical protein